MSHTDADTLNDAYRVTWLVRRLFRALAAVADEYLEPLGVTAGERAIMEFLARDGTQTVPALAACYQVSRQHVQTTMNALVAKGLVGATDNPRHKRSPLYGLSARGRAVFDDIRERDRAALDNLFRGIGPGDIATTRATLSAMHANLETDPVNHPGKGDQP